MKYEIFVLDGDGRIQTYVQDGHNRANALENFRCALGWSVEQVNERVKGAEIQFEPRGGN